MPPSRLLLAVLLLAPLARLPAQTPSPASRVAAAVRADVIRAHLEFLADDALEGRAPGTRGGELAQKYIGSQFRRLGLEPAGDSGSYYQRVPIISLTPSPTLAVAAPAALPLVWKDDYVLWSMRNDSSVSLRGEAVFVGYGIVAPELGWNDYAGLDAKGKIVVALVNDPGLQDSTIFRGKILTYYGRWTYKIEEARRQGAAGLLLVHTEESATYPWTTVLSGWTGPQVRLEAPPDSLRAAGWLQQETASRLFKSGGQDLAALTAAASRKGFTPVPLGHHARGHRTGHDPQNRDGQCVGPAPGTRPPGRGGGTDRRALRSPRDRSSRQRRFHLQRRRRQRLRDSGRPRGSRSLCPKRSSASPVHHLRGVRRRGIRPHRLPGTGQPPAGPTARRRGHPQCRRHEPLWTDVRRVRARSRPVHPGKDIHRRRRRGRTGGDEQRGGPPPRLLFPVGPLSPGPGRGSRNIPGEGDRAT